MGEPKKESKPAFGKLEIIVIVCLVSFFAWVGIPNYIGARRTSTNNLCIHNLRYIDQAANEFALQHHLANGSPINFPTDLTPYMKPGLTNNIPVCPLGGSYSVKKVGDKPTCSLGTTVTPAHVLQ